MSGITNPAEKYFKDGLWTFDGTVWRPQNQLLAYRNTLRLIYQINDATAGTNEHYFDAVPAGEVWVLSNVVYFDASHTCGTSYAAINPAATDYYIDYVLSITVGSSAKATSVWPMKAGDRLHFVLTGVTLHDILVMCGLGYIFKISE
jgi:hypothetical protein